MKRNMVLIKKALRLRLEKESIGVLGKNLRRGNKANKNKELIYHDIFISIYHKIYVNIYV